MKKKIIIIVLIVSGIVLSALTIWWFSFSTIHISQLDNNVIGQASTLDETRYFKHNQDATVDVLSTQGGASHKLFSVDNIENLWSSKWSPSGDSLSLVLTPDSTFVPSEEDAPQINSFRTYTKGSLAFESARIPDDYIYLTETLLVSYIPNPDDWTEPGEFAKLDLTKKPLAWEKISFYSTSGVKFLKDLGNNEVMFIDQEHNSLSAETRPIKKLNIHGGVVTDYYSVTNLEAAEVSKSGDYLLLTKLINGSFSTYSMRVKDKKEQLLTKQAVGVRSSDYKNIFLGFTEENYTFGEQQEGADNGKVPRDSLKVLGKTTDILKGKNLTDCTGLHIFSRTKATFVCSGSLYLATGWLF